MAIVGFILISQKLTVFLQKRRPLEFNTEKQGKPL